MFRTITAKYSGTCKRCQTAILVGSRIRYGGYGRTYHYAAECSAGRGPVTIPGGDGIFDGDADIEQADMDAEYAQNTFGRSHK